MFGLVHGTKCFHCVEIVKYVADVFFGQHLCEFGCQRMHVCLYSYKFPSVRKSKTVQGVLCILSMVFFQMKNNVISLKWCVFLQFHLKYPSKKSMYSKQYSLKGVCHARYVHIADVTYI